MSVTMVHHLRKLILIIRMRLRELTNERAPTRKFISL
jgi:hypothetical protein